MYIVERQKQVIKYIKYFREKNGYSPTFAEIGRAIGVSKARALQIVAELEKMGVLKRGEGMRNIKLL